VPSVLIVKLFNKSSEKLFSILGKRACLLDQVGLFVKQ
jgi:hypothetical protein